MHEHDASFVFSLAAYATPVFAAWHWLESHFPAKRFESAELANPYIQTLGIDPPRSGLTN
jgi:hypothetical protein